LDHGQLFSKVRQDGFGFVGVMVGDVQQPQTRLRRMAWQCHLGAQLGNDQSGGHLPLRVRGVSKGK